MCFFRLGDDIPTLSNAVYGIVAGISVPFPGYPDNMRDVCILGGTTSTCPIKKGDKFTEKVILPVIKEAPSVSV